MFICANCGVTNFADVRQAVKDRGDWVIICDHCGAINILAPAVIDLLACHTLQIAGYREI
jgi:hypothetical protein